MSEAQDKRFLVRLSPDLWIDLETWAKNDRRSINNLISLILERAVEDTRRATVTPATTPDRSRAA